MAKKICTYISAALCMAFMLLDTPAAALAVDTSRSFEYERAGFKYELINNSIEQLRVTGYTGSETDVIIPTTIDLGWVKEISDYAFAWQRGITSLTIPTGVTIIGDSAFRGCRSLSSISIRQCCLCWTLYI